MNLLLFQTPRGDTYPILERDSSSGLTTTSRKRGQLIRGVIEAYRNLVSKLDYHERLCSQLRHSPDLQVYHPSSIGPEEAQKKLHDFLTSCRRKHTRWLWADGALAFLGIFLMPIPGPNIFFFYPAARTLGHYFARAGARRTLTRDNLHFQVEPLIDQVQTHWGDLDQARETLADLQERYNLHNLEKLLIPVGKYGKQ